MSILSSELKFYKSVVVNDTSSNGGRMSTNQWTSGLTGQEWPNISSTDMSAGSTKYRKAFLKVANVDDLSVSNVRIGIHKPTTGDDKIFLIAGTQTDIQSGFGTTLYGSGKLDSNVSASASSFDVLVKDGADIIFRNGDNIRISDKATLDGAGNEEFHVVSGTPSVAGDVVTVTISGTLANGYSASNTYISSLIYAGTIEASVGSPTVTSTSGTFDKTKMTAHAIGGLYEIFTFTFTSGTAFSCVGDTLGSVGTGNISSTFQPTNSAFGTAYFTLLPAAWGGTYLSGDTVVITTTPAAYGFVEKRVVPSGATTINPYTLTLIAFVEG